MNDSISISDFTHTYASMHTDGQSTWTEQRKIWEVDRGNLMLVYSDLFIATQSKILSNFHFLGPYLSHIF